MSDGERCNLPVGKGAISFGCGIVPKGHDGPCSAQEVGTSVVARRKWEAEQREGEVLRTEIVQSPASRDEDPIGIFSSYEDRVVQARESLKGEVKDLPFAIQSWMMGAATQLGLVQLWAAWKKAEADGATSLTLSEKDINTLVPDKLRVI